jgi:Tfp pilus assembly protein PilN
MKLKYLAIFALIGVIGALIYYISHKDQHIASWETFEKTQKDKVKHHKSTSAELKKINAKKETKRVPANIKRERVFLGKNKKQINEFINQPASDWKEKLGHNLLDHRLPGTKVFIKEVSGNIKIENGKGRYVEKVIVTTITAEGKQYSFNALADSETGKVLNTWNRTIHEEFGNKPNRGMSANPVY